MKSETTNIAINKQNEFGFLCSKNPVSVIIDCIQFPSLKFGTFPISKFGTFPISKFGMFPTSKFGTFLI